MKTYAAALISLVLMGFSLPAFAQRYKYSELMLKDYEEMTKELNTRIAKAKEISSAATASEEEDTSTSDREAVEVLRDGMLILLSRPDKDNLLSKLMPDLRKELQNYRAYDDTLTSITGEALNAMEAEKLPVVFRSTYLFVLENIMGEVKSQVRDRPEYRAIMEKIRDAKIVVPKDVINDRKLRSMFKTESPSDVADKVLKALPPPAPPKVESKKATDKKDKE